MADQGAQNAGVTPAPAGSRWLGVLRLLVPALAVLYVFSRFIPSATLHDYLFFDDLDCAWVQVLHDAFARHLQFGRDIVFTYGPWGFLARGYYPATYPTAVIVWSLLSVAFVVAGRRLARNLSDNLFISWFWLVILAATASLPIGGDFDVRLVTWLAMLLALHFFVEREKFSVAQAGLLVSLGCLSLVKFTGLVATAAIVSLITVNDLFRYRRIPWSLPVWLVSLFGFWLLAGQRLDCFWMFLFNSSQITGGYTEAMMRMDPLKLMDIGGFIFVAALLCVLTAWRGWGRERYWTVLPLAGISALMFIVFKLGYVRHDEHELTSAMALLAACLVMCAASGLAGRWMAAGGLVLAIIAFMFASTIFRDWPPRDGLALRITRTFSIDNVLAPVASRVTGYQQAEYEKTLARVTNNCPAPPISGGADIYSYDQLVMFAYGLHYQPRPVIQSYSAYTPVLARLNAAWLRSDHAASNILFSIQSIDNRFPSLDDGLSWPELLTRYDLPELPANTNGYLHLTRSAVPREYHLLPLTNVVAGFGEPVVVPPVAGAPIWAEIEIKKTPLGSAISTLYKPPQLVMTVEFKDGKQSVFRVVPGMTSAGFLISPVIKDTQAFATLATPGRFQDLANAEVSSITIFAQTKSRSSTCYQTPFQFRFYRLDYPPQTMTPTSTLVLPK